jgi:hypothetical protein
MPKIGNPKCCVQGYHLVRSNSLVKWLGPAIWEAEGRGSVHHENDKSAFESARLLRQVETWTETTARLFACDCAQRVLHLYEERYPADDRPRRAIEVARLFCQGEVSPGELAAARDAAWGNAKPAWAAAWGARDAAGAAAWGNARPAWAAEAAARAAAWAAWDAARDAWAVAEAARDAAWDAERIWQTARLFEYLRGAANE